MSPIDRIRTYADALTALRPGPGLHNAGYDFDDTIIPIGSAFLARMVERRTAG